MRILFTTFIILLVLVYRLAAAQSLPKYQLGQDSGVPLTLSPEVLKSLRAMDWHREEIKGVTIDLNEDKVNDYIVMSDSNMCGTGGCSYDIIDGKLNSVIGQIFGNPVFIFDQKVNGFAVLHTYSHSSAESGSYSSFVFDGKAYDSVSCINLIGDSVDELFKRYKNVPVIHGESSGANKHYTLNEGQEFSLPLDKELTFSLVPSGNGWIAEVRPSIYAKNVFPVGPPNLAAITPPFHGPNPTDIQGWQFRNSDNTGSNEVGPKNVNAPGKIRQIQYCATVEDYINWEKEYEEYRSGRCLRDSEGCFPSVGCQETLTLEVYDLKLNNLIAGQQAGITSMEFLIKKSGLF